ncbi:MAG TPA: hypothetical protein VFS21_35015 [Roseiflexaceae bacterium]|nr:hypothetical protein [Roseiflexaceae bacterium]
MRHLRLLLAALLLALAGCGNASTQPSAGSAAPAATAASADTGAGGATALPAQPDAPAGGSSWLTSELTGTLTAALPPTPAGTDSLGGIDRVAGIPLEGGDRPLWAVFSSGMRSFDPPQPHFVAVYTRDNSGWRELGRAELESPDYLDAPGVQQVQISPERRWIEVQSGAGAHSGCYNLLSFDGRSLRNEISHCNDSPGAGYVADIDSDGTNDVVLNETLSYIFCYACGVREPRFTVLRWDGAQLQTVGLTPLPPNAPAAQREANDRAVRLAQAQLWKEAQAAIDGAGADGAVDPAFRWNAALIGLHAGARYREIVDSPYPLLAHLFYGDYDAALEVVRAYPPEQLFATPNPLVAGTVAEGFEDSLTYTITSTANLALAEQPDLAAALFLRGWATHLSDPADPAALVDIERAARLKPDDPLFSRSVEALKK